MIQRIQTIFLFLAAAAGASQLLLPYATTSAENTAPALADGVFNPFDNVGLLGLSLLGAAVSFAAIFLFRNRPTQLRLAGGALLTGVLSLALLGFSLYQLMGQMSGSGALQFGAGLAMPPAGILLLWLAMRSIRKDEALVRSMDRLR